MGCRQANIGLMSCKQELTANSWGQQTYLAPAKHWAPDLMFLIGLEINRFQ
jgi:hypothetical protein